jgi:hypothetical protein
MDIMECVAATKAIQATLARIGIQVTQMQVDLSATVACLEECAADMAEMEAELGDTVDMQMSMEDKQKVKELLMK